MTRTRPFGVRALSSIAALSLAATGLAVIAASPAAAAPAVVYDSIPDVQPASYPSLSFQAQATWEFGDYVVLGGTNRNITDITISMTSWACETGGWSTGDCETTPGSTFTHPVTMNLYEVDNSDSVPVVGGLIASVTNDVAVPYRPSPSTSLAECATVDNPTPTTWWDADRGTCQNGFAFDVDFDFSGEGALVGNDVIVTLAYNTNSYGENPIGSAGPYESLNVSINCVAPPTIGTDETAAAMFRDTTFSGSTRGLKESTQTACPPGGQVNGLRMEITADSVPAIDPLTEVTVFERDVKPNETPETYTSWHEGNPNASLDNSFVLEDGLHLGVGDASTVIKGTDLSNPAAVTITRNDLRTLIERASVEVVSGTVTYQVPLFFGNPANPPLGFTTLRSTSLSAGSNSFSQADTWATTRAFGDYTAQGTAPLGELIDAVFDAAAAAGGGVALAGYGVQADNAAVVESVVWDGTRYTFFQPVIEACLPTTGPEVTNLQPRGWDFSQTRTQGTNEFTADGLLVSTFGAAGSPDQRKAAGYVETDIALSEVGSVELDIAPGFTGVRPSLQLGFDADGEGGTDAYLVGEPWAYPNGDWTLTTNGDWADANFWSFTDFGVGGGGGYASMGTLNDYLIANPEARITEYGYSLGSGVEGSALIRSITVGCVTTPFGFEVETLAPPTTERLAGDSRFETSVEVSQSAFPDGADTVFIATGFGFADALSAAPAAAIEDAPLLLTEPNALPTAIRNELIRLDPTTVVIVGGTQAVSSSVARAIRNLSIAPTVERISGADRYATSRAIADEYFPTATNAFIATGVNFPDALAAGPAAAEVSAPVVLVPGTMPRVDAPTLALLDRLNTEQVYIAGGTAVVSGGIASQLDGLPGVNVDRLSGDGRYETAVAINDEIFGTGPLAYLATGLGFADALAGGAAAANQGAPLYITPPDCIPTDVFASITLREPSTLFILGGTAVLSLDVENLVICN